MQQDVADNCSNRIPRCAVRARRVNSRFSREKRQLHRRFTFSQKRCPVALSSWLDKALR